MPGTSSRVRFADAAAAAYAVAFYAWLALRTPGTPSTQLIGVAAFVPLGLAVAWAYWQNARLPGLDGRTRAGWHLLAASALALWISGSLWDLHLRLFGPAGWPTWLDNLELVNNLLAIGAILLFPGRSYAGRSRVRFLLDAGLTVLAGFVLALYFGLRLWFTELQGESLASAILGPGVDWVFFVAAALGAIKKRDRGTRVALVWLFMSGIAYLAANYYFTVAAYGPAGLTYRPGDAVDGLWFGAWVLRWLAARLASSRYRREQEQPRRPVDDLGPRYERTGFTYAVVSSTFVILGFQLSGSDPRFFEVLTLSMALMIALLLARQVIELRENERLFAAQLVQETRFRSFIQHSSDIVLIVDAAGRVTYASPSAARVLGTGTPVVPGAVLAGLVSDDDRPSVAQMLDGADQHGRFGLRLPLPDETARDIEAVWTDRRSDPAVAGFVVNCRDVTDRNELQRQLRHSQKLDAVGHLAGGLAHDINNILAIVGGYADLLSAEVEPGSSGADDLAHIRQAVDRAATVTRKVLAFSRRQPVLRTVLDLNRLVRDLLPLLRQSVKPKVEVRLNLAPTVWPVLADQGQVEQVLVNLATNARDAMPDGGVLEISTTNRIVDTATTSADLPPDRYVALAVTDTGTGIPPEVLDRIFEPFFSTKGSGGGMGLGLAMVDGIVRDAGGRVVVDSVEGRGTTFTVLLPRTDAALSLGEACGDTIEQPARAQTVLLVDDEHAVRTVARRVLERHGYRVIEAGGGKEALDSIADPSVVLDVLVTDLVMPGIHGRELMARCREIRPGLPIICMTGFAGEGDDPRQYGDNIVALLSKPFSSETLRRAVGAAISVRGAS